MQNIGDVYSAYYGRSERIVRSALLGNGSDLSSMVAPTATFTVIIGDVGNGPRETGVIAAQAFIRGLNATALRYAQASPGPFSMDPCGEVETELTLLKDDPAEGFRVTFHYSGGLLRRVEGSPANFVTHPLGEGPGNGR